MAKSSLNKKTEGLMLQTGACVKNHSFEFVSVDQPQHHDFLKF